MEYSFQSSLRIRNNGTAPASRFFVTIPQDISNKIKQKTNGLPRKGRGSVKVQVMIGFLKRDTSIFADKKSGSYLLPIKASIRKELRIAEGSELRITLTLL